MIIERTEPWGILRYDTQAHRFSYIQRDPKETGPYASEPAVLNVVTTRNCNLDCVHCVAKDFKGIVDQDLVISESLTDWVNASPFMLVVLTGGEPLLPPYDEICRRFIESLTGKGVILDSNGTITPSEQMIRCLVKNDVMIRVSMDSIQPTEEIRLRRVRDGQMSRRLYSEKVERIDWLVRSGIYTAVQTVVWRKNTQGLLQMVDWLAEHGIKQWYLQRLIPSHRFKTPPLRHWMTPLDYLKAIEELSRRCAEVGVQCIAKRDLRHNSVYLLMADGLIYTQGSEPGKKVKLGSICERFEFFDYVSAADHATRYYLTAKNFEEGK